MHLYNYSVISVKSRVARASGPDPPQGWKSKGERQETETGVHQEARKKHRFLCAPDSEQRAGSSYLYGSQGALSAKEEAGVPVENQAPQ